MTPPTLSPELQKLWESLYLEVLKGKHESSDDRHDACVDVLLAIASRYPDNQLDALNKISNKHAYVATSARNSRAKESKLLSRQRPIDDIDSYSSDSGESETESDPAKQIAILENSNILRNAVNQLPTNNRDVVVLRYWLNTKIQDIASALGISLECAKKRLQRGRKQLQAALS